MEGVEDRHVDEMFLIDLVHALGAEIAFGNHLHFGLSTFDGVATPDHGAEGMVARESGVGGNQEITEVSGVGDIAGYRMDGINKAAHLLDGVGKENGLEIVAILEAVANTGHDGVDVLEDGGVLNADDVGGEGILQVAVGENGGKCFGLGGVGAGNGEAGESFESNLFGMAGATDDGDVVAGYRKAFGEVFGDRDISDGDNTFDSGEEVLGSQGDADAVEVLVEVG